MEHEVGGDFTFPLPMFAGRNEDWPMWTASIEACAELGGTTSGCCSGTDRIYLDGWCEHRTSHCTIAESCLQPHAFPPQSDGHSAPHPTRSRSEPRQCNTSEDSDTARSTFGCQAELLPSTQVSEVYESGGKGEHPSPSSAQFQDYCSHYQTRSHNPAEMSTTPCAASEGRTSYEKKGTTSNLYVSISSDTCQFQQPVLRPNMSQRLSQQTAHISNAGCELKRHLVQIPTFLKDKEDCQEKISQYYRRHGFITKKNSFKWPLPVIGGKRRDFFKPTQHELPHRRIPS